MQSLVVFPQAREVPRHVRAGLRALDPTAEVVHLGRNHWIVGRVRLTTDCVRIAGGMLADANRMSVRAATSAARRKRVALALLGLQGFRPVTEYFLNDLDGRVVRDFQVSQYRMRHTSDDALFRELDQPDEARKALAEAEMRDLGRANDAYRHAFTSNFGYGVSSVAKSAPVSSARTRVSLTP